MKRHVLTIITALFTIVFVFAYQSAAQTVSETRDIIIKDEKKDVAFHKGISVHNRGENNATPAFDGQAIQPKATSEDKHLTVTATAYTASCDGCSGVTYTGINLKANPNQKVIAVDPNIIPLGSKVYVEGYGTAIAGDIGSAIKGKRIDVFIPKKSKANQWGVKKVNITILS